MLLDEQEACKDLPRDARIGETAGKMKQFASWFTHGVPGGAKLRASIFHAKTGAAVLEQVDAFFTAPLSSPSDTDRTVEDSLPLDFSSAAMACD
jgi:tRNA-dihydrouridine synthase B